ASSVTAPAASGTRGVGHLADRGLVRGAVPTSPVAGPRQRRVRTPAARRSRSRRLPTGGPTVPTPIEPCEWCGAERVKPPSGPAGRFCSARCRAAWHHDRKRQERLSERPERRCVVCDSPIDPSRPVGTILCSPACMQKRKYAAIKADPERLERHRERSRTAQYRAYHTRKPHEVARDSLQKRWQDGADRVLEADLGG